MTSTIRKAMYLSGPMTGHPDWNYPAFHRAAQALRARGFAVVNPAEAYDGNTTLPFDVYLRHDLRSILQDCDTIVVLPGWEKSPGAVLEVAVGAALGHGILSMVAAAEVEDGFVLKSTFEVHETNRERLIAALARFVYPVPQAEPAGLKVGDRVRYIAGPTFHNPHRVGQFGTVTAIRHHGEGCGTKVQIDGAPYDPWVYNDNLERIEDEPKLATLTVVPTGPEPLTTWAEADSKLLLEADRIVNSDRQRTYGHPITHHTATAAMWSAYLTRVNDEHEVIVRPQDVSILMVLDKASRIGGGDKVDNALDIAGYAQVHAKVRARQTADNGGVFE